jgi:hypothetical protein
LAGNERNDMSEVITVLDDIAKAPGEVLKWLASPKGQAIKEIVETGLEVAIPQITGIVNIFNKYTTEAVKVQTLAVAAGTAAGTASTQKAAAVVNEVGPEVLAFAQANGLAAPTEAVLLELNDLAVKFIQVFKPAAPVAPVTNVTAVKS